ncbi:MAG TPA: Txe/YoeB family addiction module toxin [Mucilaginibacter sp.]
MEIEMSPRALTDLEKWRKSGNKQVKKRITDLTNSILETPFGGIGKPEPLRYEMTGLWSRRITKEDRFVYEVQEQVIIVHSLKGHY